MNNAIKISAVFPLGLNSNRVVECLHYYHGIEYYYIGHEDCFIDLRNVRLDSHYVCTIYYMCACAVYTSTTTFQPLVVCL